MSFSIIRKYLAVAVYSWCLIFSGLPTIGFTQTTNDKPMTAAECDSGPDSAYMWDSNRNRCMLRAESTAAREQFEKCTELEGEALQSCLKESRDQFMDEDSMNHEQYNTSALGTVVAGANGAVVAHALFGAINGASKQPGGACISRKLMMAAGIASFVGELYLRFMAKDKFKDLQKNYEDESKDTYEKQVAAFTYLEEEQNAIADYAGQHAKAYNLFKLAYAATAIMAGLEVTVGTSMGTPTPCTQGEKDDDGKQKEDHEKNVETADKNVGEADKAVTQANADQTAAFEKAKVGNENLTPDEFQQTPEGQAASAKLEAANTKADTARGELSSAKGALTSAAMGMGITNMLGTSMGILALSGVSMVITGILASKAKKEQKQAEENAKIAATARSKFETTLMASSFCRSRDDLSSPKCYCFKADGSRNTERTKSETCQSLFAGLDKNLFAEAGDYSNKNKQKPQGCFRIDGVYDQNCQCKEVKNEKGDDGCFKVPVNVNQIAALGPNTGIPQVVDSMNTLFGGGLGSGQLQSGNIGQLAARVGAARNQVLGKIKADPQFASSASLLEPLTLAKALAKNLSPSAIKASQGQLGGPSAGSIKSPELAAALDKVRKDIGLSVQLGRGGINRTKAKKKTGFDLYGNDQKAGGSGDGVMAKKYDYSEAQDDIVDRKDVSIWQVISNRYTTSGLRRLFDDDSEGL